MPSHGLSSNGNLVNMLPARIGGGKFPDSLLDLLLHSGATDIHNPYGAQSMQIAELTWLKLIEYADHLRTDEVLDPATEEATDPATLSALVTAPIVHGASSKRIAQRTG